MRDDYECEGEKEKKTKKRRTKILFIPRTRLSILG